MHICLFASRHTRDFLDSEQMGTHAFHCMLRTQSYADQIVQAQITHSVVAKQFALRLRHIPIDVPPAHALEVAAVPVDQPLTGLLYCSGACHITASQEQMHVTNTLKTAITLYWARLHLHDLQAVPIMLIIGEALHAPRDQCCVI